MRDVVEIGLGKTAQRGYHLDDIAHRAEPAHPRRGRRLDRLAARRVPVPDPLRGAPQRRHDEPGHRGRAGPARRPRRAQRRGPVDAGTRTRPRCSKSWPGSTRTTPRPPRRLQEVYAEPIKPELIAERVQGHPRRRRDGRGAGLAAAHPGAGPGHPRRRRGHPGHPGHHRLGRARLHHTTSRSTSRSSSPTSTCR